MNMRPRLLRAVRATVLTTLVAAGTLASAQEPAEGADASALAVGRRVRLTATTLPGRLQRRVLAIDETAVTVSSGEARPFRVPLESITALDVHTGRKRNTLRGLAIGIASGAVLGLLAANGCEGLLCPTPGQGAVILAVPGALGGTVIGALIKRDDWQRAGLPPRMALARPASPGALGLSLTVRF